MPLILLEALRGPGRAEDVVPVPKLGDRCVCCNEASNGLGEHILPTGQSGRGTLFMRGGMDVPVCSDCRDHAIRRSPIVASTLSGMGLIVCALSAVLDWPASLPVMVAGILVFTCGVVLGMRGSSGARRVRGLKGHHPSFAVTIGRQWTQVTTTNLLLVERMRLLNGNVRIAETWRERRARKARGEAPAAAPRRSEAATAKLVQHVADNRLDDARALLATGTVDVIEAQRRLAELEAVLGGGGLQARLGKVREGAASWR